MALALSEMVRQHDTSPLGSMSPTFSRARTRISRMRPRTDAVDRGRNRRGIDIEDGIALCHPVADGFHVAYHALVRGTQHPLAVNPAVNPVCPCGAPRLRGRWRVPRLCPLLLSTTTWTVSGAEKPGPTPMTSGASSLLVPRFLLAKMASMTTSGFKSAIIRHSGSIMMPIRSRSHARASSAGLRTSFPSYPFDLYLLLEHGLAERRPSCARTKGSLFQSCRCG